MNRVLLAGAATGSGKTTITCGLLAALKARGLDTAAFKCGPDYIDTMFHRRAIGIPSHNLDSYFCDKDALLGLLQRGGATDINIIEGVMGYYDGISATTAGSTYEVARLTETPVVLVINARSMSASACAVLKGFKEYVADSNIGGVIFNGLAPVMYDGMAEIAAGMGVRPLGCFPYKPELAMESRHLGLVTAGEISDIHARLGKLAELAEQHLDIDGLLEIAKQAGPISVQPDDIELIADVKIAVSGDEAFCFHYAENFELLERLGAKLEYFSPLHDKCLPQGIQGLYITGGYPELHAERLSANHSMLADIRAAIARGMPTIAECGGFMYLHEQLAGKGMVGALKGKVYDTGKLSRFGYIQLTANADNLLCAAGEGIKSHEFHYWDSEDCGSGFTASKAGRDKSWPCVHATQTMYAGFPHLYLPSNPQFAINFISKAAGYGA